MPNCKNDSKKSYKGTEPSPKDWDIVPMLQKLD